MRYIGRHPRVEIERRPLCEDCSRRMRLLIANVVFGVAILAVVIWAVIRVLAAVGGH